MARHSNFNDILMWQITSALSLSAYKLHDIQPKYHVSLQSASPSQSYRLGSDEGQHSRPAIDYRENLNILEYLVVRRDGLCLRGLRAAVEEEEDFVGLWRCGNVIGGVRLGVVLELDEKGGKLSSGLALRSATSRCVRAVEIISSGVIDPGLGTWERDNKQPKV